MMNYIYAAHDNDADLFLPPFVAGNDKLAFRSYLTLYDLLNSPYFARYSLYRVGIINNETGCVEGLDIVCLDKELSSFIDELHPSIVKALMDQLKEEGKA